MAIFDELKSVGKVLQEAGKIDPKRASKFKRRGARRRAIFLTKQLKNGKIRVVFREK